MKSPPPPFVSDRKPIFGHTWMVLVALSALIIADCSWFGSPPAAAADAVAASAASPTDSPPTDLAAGYADVVLGAAAADLDRLLFPDWPFADQWAIGPDSLDWVGDCGDPNRRLRLYGPPEGSPPPVADEAIPETPGLAVDSVKPDIVELALGLGDVRRGAVRYRLEGRRLYAEALPAAENGAELDAGIMHAAGISGGIRFGAASAVLTAGPFVFGDFVVAATAQPALAFFNRDSLALAGEAPIGHAAVGAMTWLTASGRLVLMHADGTLGLYRLGAEAVRAAEITALEPAAGDPVAAVLQPAPAALAALTERAAALLGGRTDIVFGAAAPYTGAAMVPADTPKLYRYFTGPAGRYRLYIADTDESPYLIALFDAAGQLVVSNIEYTGAETVLEQELAENSGFFIVAAYFDSGAPGGRLIIALP